MSGLGRAADVLFVSALQFSGALYTFPTTLVVGKVGQPMNGRFVSYYRVSTTQQGRSGLGLEAQRASVRDFLNGGAWTLAGEFTEIESGKRADRPQLAAALALCRLTGATLIVAKLDRLARNVRFLLSVVEGTGTAGVVFCDLPTVPSGAMGKFIVTQMAAVAELEAGLISKRTKDALARSTSRWEATAAGRSQILLPV